jgi:serine/threonine protein kinase/WD40 repeat protein
MASVKLNIREIFSQALDVETADQRLAFLDQACQGDDEVRRKVDDLLTAHAAAGKFMNGTGMHAPTVDMPSIGEGPGSCIGPYKLREQIGDGGFGVVYVAEQEQPVARKVALEIIKPGMDTDDVIARFEAERQALALMDHPNVAKVFDAGATETGRPYFVMELVHGIAITEFCDEQKLSNRQRLELFIDVCRAVQHAHQKGIIHRDLKPSNIMVTMHDDKPVPKVIDFGVAKALSGKLTEKTVYTHYGQMVGTPLYMSPEQAQMSGLDVDTRSDVYSLGVLLYELLTGTTPFDREALQTAGFDELRRIIREDDPPRPSARVSTLNAHILSTASDHRRIDHRKLSQSLRGELDWIVMKSLEKDRSRRYESASSLAEDVQNYLDDQPVEACPPSLVYRCQKFARRNRMALTSSALVAVALFLGTIVSTWQAVQANDAKADADKQRGAADLNAQRAEESEREALKSEAVARDERDSAVAAREELRRVLYASEMNLAQDAWDDNLFGRVSQLLKNTTPRSGEMDIRGFEWHYWNRRLNGPLETHSVTMPQVGTRRMLEDTLSPDGTRLAVQYFDQNKVSVAIWDIATLREVCNFEMSRGTIHSQRTAMAFSPDGTRLAIATAKSGNLRIWDTRTGEQLFQFEDDKERVFWGFFSRDGNRVVYIYGTTEKERDERSPSDYGYKVWDLTTNKMLFSHRYEGEAYPNPVFLSPDGKKLGVKIDSKDKKALHLQIWDVETAKVLQDRAFDDRYWYRAVSPDGSRIAVQDQMLRNQFMVLDSKTLKTVSILHRGPDQVTLKVVFSPDGRLLAAPTDTRKVLIWSLPTASNKDAAEPVHIPSPLFTLPVPRSHVELRFSADSRRLHSCIHSRIKSWEIPVRLSANKRHLWSSGAVRGGVSTTMAPEPFCEQNRSSSIW